MVLPGDPVLAALLDHEEALCQARQQTRRVDAPMTLLPLLLALAPRQIAPAPEATSHARLTPQ